MSTIRVVSAKPLDGEAAKKIEVAFSKKHKDKVVFRYELDNTLIGGVLVIDGENFYDASVRGQLATIKRALQ